MEHKIDKIIEKSKTPLFYSFISSYFMFYLPKIIEYLYWVIGGDILEHRAYEYIVSSPNLLYILVILWAFIKLYLLYLLINILKYRYRTKTNIKNEKHSKKIHYYIYLYSKKKLQKINDNKLSKYVIFLKYLINYYYDYNNLKEINSYSKEEIDININGVMLYDLEENEAIEYFYNLEMIENASFKEAELERLSIERDKINEKINEIEPENNIIIE